MLRDFKAVQTAIVHGGQRRERAWRRARRTDPRDHRMAWTRAGAGSRASSVRHADWVWLIVWRRLLAVVDLWQLRVLGRRRVLMGMRLRLRLRIWRLDGGRRRRGRGRVLAVVGRRERHGATSFCLF